MKKIIITGNVGKAPEVRANAQGEQFTTFSVGVSVGTKANQKTDWVEVSCNGKLAEIVNQFVTVGSKVLVEGYPTATAYINRDNKAIATLKIFANNIEFLSKKEQTESVGNNYGLPEREDTNALDELPDDSIPF